MSETIEARWESQNEAGRRLFGQGDLAGAEQAFIAAIREATQLGADNVRLASSLSNLGQLKYKQKDLSQAEALFKRALSIRERVLGPEHFGLVQNINNLAALYYARGELEQAEPLFLRALKISESHLGEKHPEVAVTLNNLARLYFRRADFAAAAPLLTRLLTIKQESLGASHPEVATILTSLAKVRLAEGQYDAGEQLARRALGVRERIHVPNDPTIATALEVLAEICGARGKHEEEMALRQRALGIRESAMGADHPSVAATRAAIELRRTSAESMRAGELSGEYPKLEHLATPSGVERIEPQFAAIDANGAEVAPLAAVTAEHIAPRAAVAAPPGAAPVSSLMPPAPINAAAQVPAAAPPRQAAAPASLPSAAPTVGAAPPAAPAVVTPEMQQPIDRKSITWIEPPTSPALKRRPPTPAPDAPAVRSATPVGMGVPPTTTQRPSAESPAFPEQYAQLLGTPSASQTVVDNGARPKRNTEPPREISLDWPLQPQRPWLKIAAAVLVAVGISAGGWFYYASRGGFSTANGEAVPPVGAHASSGATHALKPVAAAPRTPTPAPTPAAPAPTPAAQAAHSGATPTKTVASAHPSEAQTNAQEPPVPEERAAARAPTIPNVKVDQLTKEIGDSARAAMDSVGRSIPVKPPSFTKPPRTNQP